VPQDVDTLFFLDPVPALESSLSPSQVWFLSVPPFFFQSRGPAGSLPFPALFAIRPKCLPSSGFRPVEMLCVFPLSARHAKKVDPPFGPLGIVLA